MRIYIAWTEFVQRLHAYIDLYLLNTAIWQQKKEGAGCRHSIYERLPFHLL